MVHKTRLPGRSGTVSQAGAKKAQESLEGRVAWGSPVVREGSGVRVFPAAPAAVIIQGGSLPSLHWLESCLQSNLKSGTLSPAQ